jgi:hypothetical protein
MNLAKNKIELNIQTVGGGGYNINAKPTPQETVNAWIVYQGSIQWKS